MKQEIEITQEIFNRYMNSMEQALIKFVEDNGHTKEDVMNGVVSIHAIYDAKYAQSLVPFEQTVILIKDGTNVAGIDLEFSQPILVDSAGNEKDPVLKYTPIPEDDLKLIKPTANVGDYVDERKRKPKMTLVKKEENK